MPCLPGIFSSCLARAARACGALGIVVLPLGALAEAHDPPEHGLMWHRSGLPAVFPLQVKTRPGRDYLATLTDTATGADVLAAYITGGRFFRVLVPPGTFDIRFDYGLRWRGEALRFGSAAGAGQFTLPEPLTFAVRGIGRKSGHIVDLTGVDLAAPPSERTAEAQIKPQSICQVAQLGPIPGYRLDTEKADCRLGLNVTEDCPPERAVTSDQRRPDVTVLRGPVPSDFDMRITAYYCD